ncbi:MAG: hypothetical protein GF383_16035 [Candidatus Lokiarchaeota archaeon]|nr:hypothetical protein [Candidatus Lokiarchaeota archaeon]
MSERLEIRLCSKLNPLHEGRFSSPETVRILLWPSQIAYRLGTRAVTSKFLMRLSFKRRNLKPGKCVNGSIPQMLVILLYWRFISLRLSQS